MVFRRRLVPAPPGSLNGMPGKLDGRVALVTGGGRGIGRAIALGYAREGAHVIITAARNPDEAERTAAEARDLPGRITAVAADVTSDADVERLAALRPVPDILVNNAARGMRFVNERFMTDPRPFWETDPGAWRMVMDTNVNGVFLMTRALVPPMIERGSGRIINVTVNETTMTRKGFSPYGPSKAAVEAMTKVWAAELEGTGVVVNLLLPGGATNTGMVAPHALPANLTLLEPEIVVPGAIYLALTRTSGQRIVGTEFQP
jgi:NAD(P)-dependent dehydrogenase (short-subunit alcohol dehydrogenase family)